MLVEQEENASVVRSQLIHRRFNLTNQFLGRLVGRTSDVFEPKIGRLGAARPLGQPGSAAI